MWQLLAGIHTDGQGPSKGNVEATVYGFGIYPEQFLTLNEEQPPVHKATSAIDGGRLLDLCISTEDGARRYVCNSLQTCQDQRPRPRRRYPDKDTLLAERSLYGIVLSETARYCGGTMQYRVFTKLVGDTCYDMHVRGYNMRKVFQRLRRVAQRAAAAYGRTSGQRVYVHILRHLDFRLRQG